MDDFVKKMQDVKTWLYGLGFCGLGYVLWLIIKAIICAVTGVCII